jgi:dTDP-glucose pyrophosphorylase
MRNFREHLILSGSSVKQALVLLNELSQDAILFVVDENSKLIGSITDGDIRRGLLNNVNLDSKIDNIIQAKPRNIRKSNYDINKIIEYRENNYKIIPVLDENDVVINVINFRHIKSYLPIDVVVMAGGRGQRLQPLTDFTPKPLLKVGNKPIMEHNLNRLAMFGIDDYWVTVKYLGEQIVQHFGNGNEKNINIEYIWENEPLGTIGAVSKIANFKHDYVLVTNSDLLTNIDYEHFFIEFIKQEADFAVLTIPYQVAIPYAVLETEKGEVKSFKEKPIYTYYSNGGVYLMKKDLIKIIPQNKYYNATDLMEELINMNKKIISIPFLGYWLDVGKHEDFDKAQNDINNIKF